MKEQQYITLVQANLISKLINNRPITITLVLIISQKILFSYRNVNFMAKNSDKYL